LDLGKLIEEFSVEVPNLLTTSTNGGPAVKKLIPHITLLRQYLKFALERFRNARSVSDLRASMGEIRMSLYTVINFKNDPDFQNLGKELFVDTGIINDIPGLPSRGAGIAHKK
jgi:hypothetical protein